MLQKFSFNDMLGKGWDSAQQESYCWQQWEKEDPQFDWVPVVFDIWGHAHDWDKHKRNDKGQYVVFPKSNIKPGADTRPKTSELGSNILRLAAFFPVQQARYADQLIEIAKELDERES